MLALQYQLSNGSWENVPDSRRGEFLDDCVEFNADIADHRQATAAMTQGRKLRNDRECWYSNCRMQDDNATPPPAMPRRKSCPRCGRAGTFTTVDFACDDCV